MVIPKGDIEVGNFWVKFAITEALDVLEAYLSTTKLSDTTKQAALQFITDGKALVLTL